jgi:dTMP kinase
MSSTAPGRFITLEGGEGVGKSTQIKALAAELSARGYAVLTTREPGGSPGAEAIRGLLLDRELDAWSPAAEALLFAAARSDHVDRVIRPALARGTWVLCDRFLDSSRAYQGERGGGSLPDADIMALHQTGSGGLLPDRTLIMTLDPALAGERRAKRNSGAGDRFEQRADAFHDAVSRRFREIAADDPARVRLIDASGSAQQVTARLLGDIADLL